MSELCHLCSVFKISRATFRSSPFEEKRMHQLGWFFDVEKRTYCPLCSLITKVFRDGPVQDRYAFEGSSVQGSWVQISDGTPHAGLRFWLVGKYDNSKVQMSLRLLPESDEKPDIGMGRLIDPQSSQIPFDRVKNWIYRCEHDHPCRSVPLSVTRAGRLPLSFTVIDVENRCLVEPKGDCRFLALSYVWGNSNRFTSSLPAMRALSSPNSLDAVWSQLAPSIRDAVDLTRKLGEKYLWADALCVSQTGELGSAMAKENISAMDSIYRHAVYVIVAADNDAPDRGMAGVSALSRKVNQHVAEIVPGVRLLARFSAQMHLRESIYHTRGWTYQEEQLANRSLIFINNQVYFSCPSFAYSEDIEAEINNAPDSTLIEQQQSSRMIYPDANPTSVYFKSVEAFTSRNFRYPEDILRGFAGVEAVQSQLFNSDLLAGLPTCIFDVALLWQPARRLGRRTGFPSWSWAGWVGQTRWLGDTVEGIHLRYPSDALQKLNAWLRERTFIRWYHLNEHRKVEPVWDAHQGEGVSKMFWPTSGTTEEPIVGYASAAEGVPTTPDASSDPADFARLLQGKEHDQEPTFKAITSHLSNSREQITPLLFKTAVVQFRIQASEAYLRYGSVDPVWDPSGRIVFLLLNTASNAISGYVLLDESWRQRDMSTQDFLLLSEANYYCDWSRPHEYHTYKKSYSFEAWDEYHVMCVTWRTLDTGLKVAERAGIGRLLKEAVKDAHGGEAPEVKDIVLV